MVCERAAFEGHLECLKYSSLPLLSPPPLPLLSPSFFPSFSSRSSPLPYLPSTSLSLLYSCCLNFQNRYAHQNGCPWEAATCDAAAEQGHETCLRYYSPLLSSLLPWSPLLCYPILPYSALPSSSLPYRPPTLPSPLLPSPPLPSLPSHAPTLLSSPLLSSPLSSSPPPHLHNQICL